MAAVASGVERFEGFSDDAIQFFLELQAEQSRVWFKAHQDDFVKFCRRPLELFVEELRERLVDTYPDIVDVEPHFMRIQRDTRFVRDKPPYKTNVAANLAMRVPSGSEEDRHSIPGLYVSFGLDGEYVGIGRWYLPPETLTRYRTLLDDARTGSQIQRHVDALRQRGFTLSAMESLKRVPSPFAQDHPRAELLKLKGIAFSVQPTENLSSSRALLDWAAEEMRAAAPLMHLLDRKLR
ncbi:MAG TPA: DUF2461 domain-containing protein [Chloroflexota bacterium]|nr:DUF2461 domain-containing protein [Chloroflexota bacterium]